MGTFLKRVIAGGATSFARTGAVSFATVLIMTVTLTIIGSLIFLSAILTNTLTTIQDKVDVNVYFLTATNESDILATKTKLESLPQVAQVAYTTRDQALTDFKARHATDQLTLQALQELGNNPLEASLSIKAKEPSQYAAIVDYLTAQNLSPGPGSIVDRINYYQNKTVIDRLTAAIRTTQQVGLAIVILFALASTVIALATIRLAIYTARDEIAVMRLVGASNMYIRGPFIVAGIIAGGLAALISLLLFYPATYYAGGALASWLGGFNLFTYYVSHFAYVFLVLVGSGVFLGALASWIGVRRYLKI
ncbi:MAG: Cell division protein FtsX [Parcubacteria group bacterium]|nr:Cell division protein FtsX [Parcubacteria group bacterium]